MGQKLTNFQKLKLFLTQFILPHPIALISYFFISLLLLAIASNQTLLVILSDGSPVTPLPIEDVFSERFSYIDDLLAVPILGRIVLFLFWLAIGSVVYMFVWLLQNLAVEVYDDITYAKLKKRPVPEDDEEIGWWGSSLAHTIFIGSSIILFLFYIIIAVNFLFPAWVQLFQIGLQTLGEQGGILKVILAILGTMFGVYILVLFWKLFFRLLGYVYNTF